MLWNCIAYRAIPDRTSTNAGHNAGDMVTTVHAIAIAIAGVIANAITITVDIAITIAITIVVSINIKHLDSGTVVLMTWLLLMLTPNLMPTITQDNYMCHITGTHRIMCTTSLY